MLQNFPSFSGMKMFSSALTDPFNTEKQKIWQDNIFNPNDS